MTLHHIPDPKALLALLASYLVPGGLLFASEFLAGHWTPHPRHVAGVGDDAKHDHAHDHAHAHAHAHDHAHGAEHGACVRVPMPVPVPVLCRYLDAAVHGKHVHASWSCEELVGIFTSAGLSNVHAVTPQADFGGETATFQLVRGQRSDA